MTPEEYYARFMAVQFTTRPFPGRAKLLAMAAKINAPQPDARKRAEDALRALEMTPRQREIAALRGELDYRVLHVFGIDVAPAVVAARKLRAERRSYVRHYGPYGERRVYYKRDPIAERMPGEALKRFTLDVFDTALRRAHFRRTRRGHENDIVFVPIGQEDVKTEIKYVSPREAGLPRRGYWVAQSRFIWHISPAILRVPEDQRVKRGVLYLAPNVRVHQGRGTNLVVERT